MGASKAKFEAPPHRMEIVALALRKYNAICSETGGGPNRFYLESVASEMLEASAKVRVQRLRSSERTESLGEDA